MFCQARVFMKNKIQDNISTIRNIFDFFVIIFITIFLTCTFYNIYHNRNSSFSLESRYFSELSTILFWTNVSIFSLKTQKYLFFLCYSIFYSSIVINRMEISKESKYPFLGLGILIFFVLHSFLNFFSKKCKNIKFNSKLKIFSRENEEINEIVNDTLTHTVNFQITVQKIKKILRIYIILLIFSMIEIYFFSVYTQLVTFEWISKIIFSIFLYLEFIIFKCITTHYSLISIPHINTGQNMNENFVDENEETIQNSQMIPVSETPKLEQKRFKNKYRNILINLKNTVFFCVYFPLSFFINIRNALKEGLKISMVREMISQDENTDFEKLFFTYAEYFILLFFVCFLSCLQLENTTNAVFFFIYYFRTCSISIDIIDVFMCMN